MPNFWCRLGWHTWTKWSEPKPGEVHKIQAVGIQFRRCEICGKQEKNIV